MAMRIARFLFALACLKGTLLASAMGTGNVNGHPELFPSSTDAPCSDSESEYLYNFNMLRDGFVRVDPPSRYIPEFQYSPDAIDVSLSHLESKGIGFNKGYTTLSLKTAPFSVKQWPIEVLFDVRGHVFNNGKWASNIGVGGRFFASKINKVLGINLYYDFRFDRRSYNQLGIGFEMLGADFDLSLNGYIPLGSKSHCRVTKIVHFPSGGFAFHIVQQRALSGFSGDVGTSLKRWYCTEDWDLTIGAGPYYYGGHCGDYVRGGQFRFGIEYIDLVNVEVRVSCDNVFHGIIQGIFGLNFSFGGSSCCPNLKVPKVHRNEIIVLHERCFWDMVFPQKRW